MAAGSAPLPAGSSCLLASLWSSWRSVCHWVNLGNRLLTRHRSSRSEAAFLTGPALPACAAL